jgi:hypothetical protein
MLRERRGLTPQQVADAIGVDRTTITKYETGGSKPTRSLQKLAGLYRVSVDYLLGNTVVPLPDALPLPDDNKKIPIIGTVKCGVGGIAYEDHEGEIGFDAPSSSEYFALRCRGSSMIGAGIYADDLAIVRVQPDVNSGELAVVVIDDEEGTLKRIRKQENAIILESATPGYAERSFVGKDMRRVRIIGKVVEVRRKY